MLLSSSTPSVGVEVPSVQCIERNGFRFVGELRLLGLQSVDDKVDAGARGDATQRHGCLRRSLLIVRGK